MSRRLLLGSFAHEKALLEAVLEARRRGYPVADVHTPYPVHGLDEAMGLRPSRLGIACFGFGLLGVLLASGLQAWTHGVDWRLNVGGRPFNAWPAYVPVAFEVMVLMAGVLTVLAFLVVSRLYPGKPAEVLSSRASDDHFLVVIEATGPASDTQAVLDLLRTRGAVAVEDREASRPPRAPGFHRLLQWGLAGGFAVTVALNLLLTTDPARPNPDFLPGMVTPVAYPSDAPHPSLPGRAASQPPQEGTIARGHMPLHLGSGLEAAERAGRELENPLRADDAAALARGALVFSRHCAVCHGGDGGGNGPVTRRGVPPPPSLLAGASAGMPPGRLFHVVSRGQGNMAAYDDQLSVSDRWAVVLHVMRLQGRIP